MGSIPAAGEEKFRCLYMLSFVSFAGMTLNVLSFGSGRLLEPPVQGESPPVQVKDPYSSLHDYL